MRFTREEKGSLIREQSPVAIYSLTPGADAFTMRETRDGLLRKTVVWTLAGGAWTMEVFDETVSPRELVRRDVRTSRPTARGVAHTLARGGEVVETETEEIDGIGPMPIRETRGVGAEARTTYAYRVRPDCHSKLPQVRQAKLGRTNSGRSYIVKKSTYD